MLLRRRPCRAQAATQLIVACVLLSFPGAAATYTLSNERLESVFDDRGLTSVGDRALTQDAFWLKIDNSSLDSRALQPSAAPRREQNRLIYHFSAPAFQIDVAYELRPGWRFVSKQISVTANPGAQFRVNVVKALDVVLAEPIRDTYVPRRRRTDLELGAYGAFLRLNNARGLFALVQNPFLEFVRAGNTFSLSYAPEMDWKAGYGPFLSDRACIGPYESTGVRLPSHMTPEWKLNGESRADGMEAGEIAAFTECVRAFLIYRPLKPLRFFVGWCVNDYQINVGTPEGRAEYKRVINRAAELGSDHVLFAPANSALSRRADSVDEWSWEYVLWLGLGQKIRKNEWDPRSDAIPPSVQEMLDYAQSKRVKLTAYVYPVLPFSQSRDWLATSSKFQQGRQHASLGVRSLQDWLIQNLLVFYRRMNLGGYAFDYTFLWYDGTSRYAQWWGWRRVMETLRNNAPEMAIDGRQLYQEYGPWTWLAGSYPHPTSTDEQPESFVPFPDLHFDRVSADRQRYTAYRYRNFEFAPSEIVPGFITHQTPRNDDAGEMPTRSFRARDWDYLGWKYSLLSSIGTAGWNNVLNMIPARDQDEDRNFSAADKAWFRRWLDWADTNKEYLRQTRTILGQPAVGRVDGTSAINGDRGYVFLFNPNYRRLTADFQLDASIGLSGRGSLLLKELYPQEGRVLGRYAYGDRVSLPVDGTEALVAEIVPTPVAMPQPVLINGEGTVRLVGTTLAADGVRGETGTASKLAVQLPATVKIDRLTVNGKSLRFSLDRGVISANVHFAGEAFSHSPQVGTYDPAFTGGSFTATFRVPARIMAQLAARKRAWPIPWTPEDLRTTWLAPERLLLYLHIAEPDDKMSAAMKIDGAPVELKRAYSSVRVHAPSFVGFYADVSQLAPAQEHRLELQLPKLVPGQFQGVFFDNVEAEFTGEIGAQ